MSGLGGVAPLTAPEEHDVRWAYEALDANRAVRLNSSLEALWADRPRDIPLDKSRSFTWAITQSLGDSAFMHREDFTLPNGIRLYGIHDVVLNCLCAERPELGVVDIVFFSGVVSAPLLRFGIQIMLSRLGDDQQFQLGDGSAGGLEQLAECALGYTIWQLIEDIPITLADLTNILVGDDLEKLATTMDGMTSFLFFHEVGHIACGHIERQRQIVQFSAGPVDFSAQEFEADAFAIRCIKPEFRSAMVLYARIFLEIIADLETMGFDFGPSHPKATARVHNLLETFRDEIDDLRKRLLTDFLDNRRALVERPVPEDNDAVPTLESPAGEGTTREVQRKSGDRILKLPPKQICHAALDTLISAYREKVTQGGCPASTGSTSS